MRYCKLYIILVIIVFSSFAFGQKQDMRFHHLTVENGLSQNWVTAIFQDSYGLMWFGTGGNGINKYNGYEFIVYRNDPKKRNTLSSNYITAIYEDKKKRLWVGTTIGLNLYDRENDKFIRYPGLESEYIAGLYESDANNLLVISQGNIFEIKNNTALALFNRFFLGSTAIGTLQKDQFGRLWLATGRGGIFHIDIKNKTFLPHKHDETDLSSLSSNSIVCTYLDSKKRIWIGTSDKGIGLLKFRNDSTPYFQNFIYNPSDPNSIEEGAVRAILDDGAGNLWVSSENKGLNILDINNFEKGIYSFTHYYSNTYDNTSLSNNSIHCLFRDRQETIWIGTYGAGINCYNKLLFQFEHYKQIPGVTNGLSDNIVNVIFEDGYDLWFGTENGLNILNRKTGKYKVFQHSLNNKKSIGSNAIWSIFKDSRNNMWIGTWAGGLNLYNRKTENFTHYLYDSKNPEGISSNNIFGMIEDNRGFMYLATMGGGLCRYDYRTNKFKTYRTELGQQNSLSNNWVTAVYKTKSGEIWVTTMLGVGIFNTIKETFTNFLHDTANLKSISYLGADAVFEDSKQNIWLATPGGLNLFIRKDSTFINYREEDGLPDNAIKSICEDKQGNLWLGTNNGLSKFVNAINIPKKPVFKNYSKSDGLQGNEFGRKSCLLGSDGKLYFGGTNGFNAFYPDSIKANPNVPEIVFTDFLLFNKNVKIGGKDSPLKKSISETKELMLNHSQNVITFKYAALNYIFPEKNQYKYIMEGFENKWNDVGSKREATYTNLSPGKYTFRVKGSNNSNIWNEKGASIKIIILPPWWLTWWFKIIALFILLASIYVAYYLRVAAYRQKQKELSVLVMQRTQEISDVNKKLLERQTRIEEYAREATNQSEELKAINNQLMEKQTQIEEQSEELQVHTENLKDANQLLLEKQKLIEAQTEIMAETNEELTKLNATKDKLFSLIAHDLKNPFHSIIGFSELLKLKLEHLPIEKTKKYIDLIYSVSSSGYELLNNLLQWSRSQTGRITFEPDYISPAKILIEVLNLEEGSAQSKNISFQQLIDPDFILYADENMLKTIFRNIISNAVKFSHQNGKIIISVTSSGNMAEISIQDFGVGIPEENIKRLFDIDSNIVTKGTSNETGTGLGLIICKEFVERHKGKIWVESKEGKGSTFKFTIPVKNFG